MSTGQLGRVICIKLKFRGEVSARGREHIHFYVVVGVTRMVMKGQRRNNIQKVKKYH